MKKAVEAGCDTIYFEPVFTTKECTCRNLTDFTSFESQVIIASALCRDADIRFVLKFPRITNNHYLDSVLSLVSKTLSQLSPTLWWKTPAADGLMRSHPAPVLSGSIGLNIFNHEGVQHLSSRFGMVTLSPELSRDEIRLPIDAARLGDAHFRLLIAQGRSEAMVSEDCILQPWLSCYGKGDDTDTNAFFGIMDVTGQFPVRIDGECRSHIYNSAEICLIDHLPSSCRLASMKW